MTALEAPRIYVLAGVNGAGKSSIVGAAFRVFGADYYNPDEAARALMAAILGCRRRLPTLSPGIRGKGCSNRQWQDASTLRSKQP
jgi:hypothetical protein